jgi:predicted subunit of tRNA(5-methylaminomethyl-2-thiouridylate) methyltransferase
LDIARGAVVAEVTSMDEKVTVRYIWPFEGVGVRDADYSDRFSVWRRESRRSAQTK